MKAEEFVNEKRTKLFDRRYVNHCISDLEKWRKILIFTENIDCIINVLKDYKRL